MDWMEKGEYVVLGIYWIEPSPQYGRPFIRLIHQTAPFGSEKQRHGGTPNVTDRFASAFL